MEYIIIISRDANDFASEKRRDLDRAKALAENLLNNVHNGNYGLGEFEIVTYEVGDLGQVERCVEKIGPINVPVKRLETAAE